jgi:hypothetical protein
VRTGENAVLSVNSVLQGDFVHCRILYENGTVIYLHANMTELAEMSFATVDESGVMRSLNNLNGETMMNLQMLRMVAVVYKRRRRRRNVPSLTFSEDMWDNVISLNKGKDESLFLTRFLHSFANLMTFVLDTEELLKRSISELYCSVLRKKISSVTNTCIKEAACKIKYLCHRPRIILK